MTRKLRGIISVLLCISLIISFQSIVFASGETAKAGTVTVEENFRGNIEVPYYWSGVDSTYNYYTAIDITILFDKEKLNFDSVKTGKLKTSKGNTADFVYTDKDIANKNGFVKLSFVGQYDKTEGEKNRTDAIVKSSIKKNEPLFYIVFKRNSSFKKGKTEIILEKNKLFDGESAGVNTVLYNLENGEVRLVEPSKNESGTIKIPPVSGGGGVSTGSSFKGSGSFVDIGNVKWAHDAIDYVAKEGIMIGVSDDHFQPEAGIKRGDVALITDRIFDINVMPVNIYSDIPGDMYYSNAIGKLTALGIAKGYGKGKYLPENIVSRQEIVTFLYRALKVNDMLPENVDVEKEISKFADKNDIEEYAKIPMATFISMGIIKGRSGNKLVPEDMITRAEASSIFYRLNEYVIKFKS